MTRNKNGIPALLGAATLALALACAGATAPASAQAARINDCTLLTDPTALHNCVERARQGGTSGTGQSAAQDAFAPNRNQGATAGNAGARSRGSVQGRPAAARGKAGAGNAQAPQSGAGSRGGKIP